MKLLVTATALAVCGVSQAGDLGDPPRMHVRYDDLNLHTRRGAEVLLWRIESAADVVCHSYDSAQLSLKVKYNACRGAAIGGAVRAINNEILLALYRKTPEYHG